MKLEGSLDAFSLPDIFALLSMTKKTGGLHLRRAHAHGVVWFTTGAVTGGASDVARQSLARRVVGTGCVDPEALQAALDRVGAEEGLGVVRALGQDGAVDEAVLHDLAGEHVVDTVFDLLRWPDGSFAFVVDEANPDDVGVSCQVDDVVTEARRRLEVWGGVAAAIPSPQAVLAVQTALDDDPQLSRDEWSLLALVDGRRTVASIVGQAGRGEFAVVSTLADLVGRGLLRLTDGAEMSALRRARELIETLEGGPAAVAESAGEDDRVEPVLEPVVEVIDFLANGHGGSDEDYDEDDEDEDEPAAAVAPLAAVPTQPRDSDMVTPQRPEPFLPRRLPEYPEEPPPAMAAVAGGAVAEPVSTTFIDRDPSVNKSLLLRLIAGVRGL